MSDSRMPAGAMSEASGRASRLPESELLGSRHLSEFDTPRSNLAAVLQALAITKVGNVSLRRLSEQTSLSPSVLARLFRGPVRPTWSTVLALLAGLDASQVQVEMIQSTWLREAQRELEDSGSPLPGHVVRTGPEVPRIRRAGPPRRPAPLRGLGTAPSPLLVDSAEEFVAALREVRLWVGMPSLRTLENLSSGRLRRATVADMLSKAKLPKYELMMAFLETCGVEDRETWAVIWRRLRALEDARGAA